MKKNPFRLQFACLLTFSILYFNGLELLYFLKYKPAQRGGMDIFLKVVFLVTNLVGKKFTKWSSRLC